MEIGEALYSQLSGTTELKDYVGTRIYPGMAPQGAALPYLTYNKISDPIIHAMVADPNISRPRYQISSWSTSYSQARAIARQVKNSLRDYSGMMGGTTGVNVQRVFFDDEIELPEVDTQTKAFSMQVAQDYILWHSSS